MREAIETLIGYDKIWIYVGINSILCTHPDTRPTCIHLLYAWARAQTCLSGTGEWIVPKVCVSVPWIPGGWGNIRVRKVCGTWIWEEVSSNRGSSGITYYFNSKLVKNQVGVWLLSFTTVPYTLKPRFGFVLNTQSGVKTIEYFQCTCMITYIIRVSGQLTFFNFH